MSLSPGDDQGYVLQLRTLRVNLVTLVNAELAYQLSNGSPKPSYSLDGRSVSWTEWYSTMLGKLKDLDEQIQRLDQPSWVFERGYT